MNPLAGVGLVYAFPGRTDYRGTCFAYKEPWFWITARHVIEGMAVESDLDEGVLGIGISHQSGLTVGATRVEAHPTADLAIVIAGGGPGAIHIEGRPVEPFTSIENPLIGTDFWAFGYPIDHARGAPDPNPTPRLFKGHVQRLLSYSASPYEYVAAEMSMPAPRGLSGGPMFNPIDRGQVYGIVVANEKSYTTIDTYETELAPNRLIEREIIEVVSYGLAVRLTDYKVWIEQQIEAQWVLWQEAAEKYASENHES